MPIRDSLPATFDNRLSDRFLHVPRTFSQLRSGDDWSRDLNNFTSYNRTWRFCVHVRGDLALEPQAFNRLLTAGAQFVVAVLQMLRQLVDDLEPSRRIDARPG